VTVEDVEALVPEAVPGSMWAFVDAVGMRQRIRALELLERLIEDRPAPVLLAVLHRRLRELIEVQDRLERGESPGSLVRSMRLVPFRAETLARQARGWTARDLDAALDGLVELDAQVKGVGGRASTEARDRLAFDLWITDLVAPA
jgi:DNA polymerase III delta subunit